MKITAIKPRGYCYGVVNAINVVKEAVLKHPDKQVYVLGIIIHNKFIKEALDEIGVISLVDKNKSKRELLESIDSGVIVFSAHGTSEELMSLAQSKNLIVYNAVCKDVVKTQDIVKEYLAKDYDVLYIGKAQHPESEAMLSISKNIKLISNLNDLEDLVINDKTIVTNQTTMSVYDTKEVVDKIVQMNQNVTVTNEICKATQMRQEALFDLKDYDLVYIVGDQLSNNSNNLAKVAKRSAKNVRFIESVMDINNDDLINIKNIAVSSGASTPHAITEQVIDYLNKYPNTTEEDRIIDYDKLL